MSPAPPRPDPAAATATRDPAADGHGAPPVDADRLPETVRRLHRALLDALLTTGEAPSRESLADRLAVEPDGLSAALHELAAADYAAFDGSGRLTCLYPLSPSPTLHLAIIDGQRRHAMCAIDLLGIPVMLGRELALEGRCAACAAPIALRVRPGAVTMAEPASALVVARRDEAEPAVTACCPFTVFACGPAHAARLATAMPGTRVLPLAAALAHAEMLFGEFFAPTLPASRPRGRGWDDPHGR